MDMIFMTPDTTNWIQYRTFFPAETPRALARAPTLTKISSIEDTYKHHLLRGVYLQPHRVCIVGRLTLVPHLASYYYLLQTKPLGKQVSTIESKIMQLKILSSLIIAG